MKHKHELKEDENSGLLNPTGVGKDLAMLLKYRKTKYSTLINQWDVVCKKCVWPIPDEDNDVNPRKLPKPIRGHHCSLCQECVMNMDHHCPWINNCVGMNNHWWFLLFIFWTWMGSIFMNIQVYLLSNEPGYYRWFNVMPMLTGIVIAVAIGLLFFNCWQWFLALKGTP